MSLTVDEAVDRLAVIEDYDPGSGPQPCVHTFRTKTLMLGAHWPVAKAREAFEKFGVCGTDDALAVGLGHTLLVVDDTGPIIFETKGNDDSDA